MNIKRPIQPGLLLLLALSLVLGAFGQDDPIAPTPAPADLDSFFASLPAWQTVSLVCR